MNNLGHYINKLLLENDIVIIPGLGAFVSKYKPAEINNETGYITPPSKEFSFNQQIKNNDSLLVGFVAESESLSRPNALKAIEKECERIIYRLDKGENVLLEEVGVFFLNKSNEIQFEPHFKGNMLLDSFGLEPVNIFDDSTETEIEPVTASIPIPETEKKTGRLWYLLLIIPLAAIALYVLYKNQDKITKQKQENHLNTDIRKEATNTIPLIDSVQTLTIDSTQVPATDSVETIEIEPNVTEPVLNDSAKYYLIGGSFKEEENAEKYIKQFNIEGYEPFYIGKSGDFHLVGIGRYNTQQEAFRANKDYIAKNPNSEVWVYEKQ